MSLAEIARERAAHQPDRRAFTFLDFRPERVATSLSYGELHDRAASVAAALQSTANRGDRALLLFKPGADFAAAFLGCLYAGVIAVPGATPRRGQRGERLQRIIADAGIRLVVTTEPLRRAAETFLPDQTWICTDELDATAPYEEVSASLEDVAYLQYSSGSTGDPKGIMITHGNLAHQSAAIFEVSGATTESCCVSWLPTSHDMGLVGGLLQPLFGGYHGVLMSPEAFVESPYRWLQAISDFRADLSPAPNFAYEACLSKIEPEQRTGLDLSSWRLAFTGAETVRAKTLDEFTAAFAAVGFKRSTFFPVYGLAEATLMVSGGREHDEPAVRCFSPQALETNRVEVGSRPLVGCGMRIRDQRIAIVNPDTCEATGANEVGEIWVAGPSVAAGYWNRSDLTAEIFQAGISGEQGDFLRTGDLGFIEDGELYICGRLKDLILIRGRNLHAPDIEATVQECHVALRPSCGAAFAVDVEHEERLVVVQEVDRSYKGEFDEVFAAIRRAIAEEHEIQVYAVVLVRHGKVPKTPSGKVQRRVCRELYLAGRLSVRSAWTADKTVVADEDVSSLAAQEIEHWLIQAVADGARRDAASLSGLTPVPDLGLTQEVMLQVIRRAEVQFGRPLPTTIFLDHATIADLARYLCSVGVRMHRDEPVAAMQMQFTPSAVTNEPIAIVGIGCRFPGASGPAAFWKMLCDGVDAVTEVPADRWDIDDVYDPNPLAPAKMNTRCGGFLKDLDRLDRKFFGLSIREAIRSDPQHRLMLEVAWEALEDAGVVPEELSGTQTGVFVGISSSDYAQMQFSDASMTDAYSGLGCALTIAASRVSHFLNLRGPAIAVDTACSSSLSAVHLACSSIRKGECSVALAAGVNVLLSPIVTMCLTKAGMMSPDGRCKAFDARANGYVRSEGAGVVVLKPLSRAQADGDSIYAVIRGTASNQDGRSNGISAPNGEAQQDVLLAACHDAGIKPGDLDYVEAHGTGTAVGDPIEAKALGTALAMGRAEGSYCGIGSVKTNIGHAESAAGIASVIKAALILKHRVIPPSLHFETPNPMIPFDVLPIRVQTALGPLPERDRPVLAGVNGFGVGGTNVHLVLEEPARTADRPKEEAERSYMLPLSARTPASLQAGAKAMADALLECGADVPLRDICYTAGARRTHMEHRLAATGKCAGDIAEALMAYATAGAHASVATGVVPTHGAEKPKLVFAFSGQGSQWCGMGRGLLAKEPVFRQVLEQCDALFHPYTGWSLLDELMAPASRSRLDDTEVVQPALFAIQVGLAALWRSWGIVPDALVGHSAGEVAAAHVAGALSLEAAARLITNRGKLMQQATGAGKMASIELPLSEVEPLLAAWNDRLSIAAVNSPTSLVVSGETEALADLVAKLRARGVIAVELPVNYAFHSAQMEPFRAELVKMLAGLSPETVRVPMCSTVTGAWCNGHPLDARYWGANVRQAVLLAPAIEAMARDGAQIFVEIGPHPVISGSISRTLKAMGAEGTVIASLRRDEDEQATLMMAAARLYCEGRGPDWKALQPIGATSHQLPSYQWDKQRFWLDVPDKNARRLSPAHPLLGVRMPVAQPVWQSKVDVQAMPFVRDLRVAGRYVIPGGVLVEAALAAASELFGERPFALNDIRFDSEAQVPGGDGAPVLQSSASTGTAGDRLIRIFSQSIDEGADGWNPHVEARASAFPETASVSLEMDRLQELCGEEFEVARFYRMSEEVGVLQGPSLRALEQLRRGSSCALGRIRIPELAGSAEKYCIHPVIFEATTEACRAVYGALGLQLRLSSLQRIRVLRPCSDTVYAFAQMRTAVEAGCELPRTDVWLVDEAGELIAMLEGAEFAARQDRDQVIVPLNPEQWLYDITWELSPRPRKSSSAFQNQGNWLILTDTTGVGERLAAELRAKGERCITVQSRDTFARLDANTYTARPSDPEDLRRIVTEALAPKGPAWRGVVHLWSLDSASGPVTAETITADQTGGVVSIVHALQAIATSELARPPRLWTVTRGAQQVGDDSALQGLSQSTVWGLGKVIAIEHPELKCCRVDIGDQPEDARSLFEECWSNDREDQVALRGDQRYVARLVRHAMPGAANAGGLTVPAEPYRVEISEPGNAESVVICRESRRTPAPGEVEVRVQAAALDWRSLGASRLGHGCAGTVVRVGPDVEGFSPGDEVIVLAPGCASRYVTVPYTSVVRRPAALAPEHGAASVRTFAAALLALREVREGDFVLVNGAGSRLADAAVQVARRQGAFVFAVARSEAERSRLTALGAEHVFAADSLSLGSEVLTRSGGRGVALLLNCSPGFDLAHSLPALSPVGRIVDAAKWESGRSADTSRVGLTDNVALQGFDLDALQSARPDMVRASLEAAAEQLASGVLEPLALDRFPVERTSDALRSLPAAGSVVVELPQYGDETSGGTFREGGTYLITGGLGGLGLGIAKRMVERGASHLVLVGRRSPSTSAQKVIDELESRGATVMTASVDVSDEEQVRSLLDRLDKSMAPLRGVIHAAGMLDNGLLLQMNEERMRVVMHSKIAGAWHLHTLTAGKQLDFFVLFSSLASLIGSPGQSNYAAANAFLDALAVYRRSMGLPALTVAWGPWAEIGMAADVHNAARLEEGGMGMLPPEKAMDLLEQLAEGTQGMVGAIAMNWQLWSATFPIASDAPFVSGLIPGAEERALARAGMLTADVLKTVEPEARLQRMEAAIHKAVCQSLQLDAAALTMNLPLTAVGLDSIAGLELKNRIECAVDVVVQTAQLLRGPTITELATQLLAQMDAGGAVAEEDPTDAPYDDMPPEGADAARLLSQLDEISDEEVSSLLQSLTQAQGAD